MSSRRMRSADPEAAIATSDVLTVGVGGMSCDNCAASIARRVSTLDGVLERVAHARFEDARVRFDPARIEPARVLEAIADAGYSVRPESAPDRESSEATEFADKRRRMLVGLVASGAIMLFGMGVAEFGLPDFPGRVPLIAALSALVLFWVGSDFHFGAWRAARAGTTNMDTLVSLGANVAFFYSLAVLLLDLDPRSFPVYFESAAMIVTLVLIGKVLEARGKREASGAVRALLERQPERARVERDGEVLHLEDHRHRCRHRDHLAAHQAELLVVVEHRVHVLDPDRVDGTIQQNPLPIFRFTYLRLRGVSVLDSEHAVGPLVGNGIEAPVELAHRHRFRIHHEGHDVRPPVVLRVLGVELRQRIS